MTMRIKPGIGFLILMVITVGLLVIPGVIDRSKAQEDNLQDIGQDAATETAADKNTTEIVTHVEKESPQGSSEETPESLPDDSNEIGKEAEDRTSEDPSDTDALQENEEDRKVAYLTFDDGPSKTMTRQILQVLDRYGIKATFFVLGKMVDKNPDVMKLTYDGGHAIGNHTYTHNYDIIYNDTDSFLEEVYRTEEAIRNAVGNPSLRTRLVRLPGGSHAEYKQPTVKVLEDEGFQVHDWNSLNGDSEGDDPTADYLYNRFKETYRHQDRLIILMHDTDEKTTTLKALPSIIEHLLLEGYSFGTLED
jgi:peptidoglycan/xylan/chitin deacetylase (PgdA/CDA1 family)